MKPKWLIAIAGAALVLSVSPLRSAGARSKVEQPVHKVEHRYPGFELRLYGSRLVAEVEIKDKDPAKASNSGFRILADYIFGNNTKRQSIEMTAPVGRSQKIDMTAPVGRAPTDQGWWIRFTMPAKWTMKTIPKPNNRRVRLRQVPATRYVVRSFSGAPGAAKVREYEDELRAWAKREGVGALAADAVYNRYDPPWIPWFARHNEIWIELRSTPPAVDHQPNE